MGWEDADLTHAHPGLKGDGGVDPRLAEAI